MKNFAKIALLVAATVFAVGTTAFTLPAYAADCKVTGGLKSADTCAKVSKKKMVVQQACSMEIHQSLQWLSILCFS